MQGNIRPCRPRLAPGGACQAALMPLGIAEGEKAAQGRPQAFIFSLATDRPQWDGEKG